jgi:hypothetical protein
MKELIAEAKALLEKAEVTAEELGDKLHEIVTHHEKTNAPAEVKTEPQAEATDVADFKVPSAGPQAGVDTP